MTLAPDPFPRRDLMKFLAAVIASARYLRSIGDSYWAHPQTDIFLPAGT